MPFIINQINKTLLAAIAVIAVTATGLAAETGRQPDVPTGEYFAGKTQHLPAFPYELKVYQGPTAINLRFDSAFSRPTRQIIRQDATSSSVSDSVYWVIGPAGWAEAMTPFIRLRTALGTTIRYVTTEEIDAAYANIADPADRVKAALKDAYDAGVRYALLVGDETHCPIRYAFDSRASTPPALDLQQLCDLYFGEFDGDWDVDRDGVYGEPTEDSADLMAEVLIGRLPLATGNEVSAWVHKWKQYVLATGNTDYLGRVLGMASDQMRDDESGAGQAAKVVRSWPGTLSHDTTTLLEWPSGNTVEPTAPWAASILSTWNQGWGIVHLYAHGRFDGFALKTSLYNNWPKSYVLTDPNALSPHGWLGSMDGPAGVVYSVSCNQAAFDAEVALGATAGQRCVAADLLASSAGGAVMFVGYSRWGWVYSSHVVATAFWEGVFDSSYTAGRALQRAKLLFPYLLDVAYGHNIYGDPAMNIWQGSPRRLTVTAPARFSAAGGVLPITLSGSGRLDECTVTLMSEAGVRLAMGQPDAAGQCELTLPVLAPQAMTLTVSGPEYVPVQHAVEITFSTGIEDDVVLPTQIALGNYPNPFNAATRIVFGAMPPGRWKLEVYNSLGQLVFGKSLTEYDLTSGVIWDASSGAGSAVPSGLYIARLRGHGAVATHKLMLLK